MKNKNYVVECILAYYLIDNKVKEELVSWEKIENNANIKDYTPAVCNFIEIEDNEIGYAVCYYEIYDENDEIISSNLDQIDIEEIKKNVKKMNTQSKVFEYIYCK
ncbi:hypothetical protein [Pseudostreptobacillus hongkongensis]|uniref:hypothetical protein n=1 Tax=Pseudostreptobacillus hongkongensis TaxID=1162717 RepID=UPI0028D03772|nr:hypothetical protein [Pseudostreptobacillus hongkongensis]